MKQIALMSIALVLLLQPAAEAASDYRLSLLGAMKAELQRNFKSLRFGKQPAPYFISYTLRHIEHAQIGARDGAIFTDKAFRFRKVNVDMRVGDYRFDSSELKDRDQDTLNYHKPSSSVPLDNNLAVLRRVLWRISDYEYKVSLTGYLRMRGKQVFSAKKKSAPSGSLTKEKAIQYVGKTQPLRFDAKSYRRQARRLSRKFVGDSFVASSVEFAAKRVLSILVNSEGTQIISERLIYHVLIKAAIRATDGTLLRDQQIFYAGSPDELPGRSVLDRATQKLKNHLLAQRKAPILAPYTGPAILAPRATGVFFHETIGHRLEGHRQKSEESGQTFKSRLGTVILPTFLTIYDDPTRRLFRGQPLNGHYLFDEEGVRSQRVDLITRGVLRRFLMSRKPVLKFTKSNGHGRSDGSRFATSRMGNLFIISSKTVSPQRLKQLLLAEVRRQKKPFGLIISSIVGGSTNTSAYGYQAFKGVPRAVYKVDAKTGKETLVRGVEFIGTPLTSLKKIMATSNQYLIFNGYCGAESGYVPVSTIAPATLFSEIELQRSPKKRERGTLLPAPNLRTK